MTSVCRRLLQDGRLPGGERRPHHRSASAPPCRCRRGRRLRRRLHLGLAQSPRHLVCHPPSLHRSVSLSSCRLSSCRPYICRPVTCHWCCLLSAAGWVPPPTATNVWDIEPTKAPSLELIQRLEAERSLKVPRSPLYYLHSLPHASLDADRCVARCL